MGGKKLWWALILGIPVAAALLVAAIVMAMAFFVASIGQEEPQMPGNGFAGGEISEYGLDQINPEYLPIYQAAAKQYGVPWNLIAAIHRVETNFSTISPMVSYAGAEGHFQFMPCTWVGWSHPTCGGLGAGNISVMEKSNPASIKQYGGLGVDGNGDGKADPFDLVDAAYTAAKYLAANGAADGNYEKAIFAYNHSQKYVADVTGYMNQFAIQKPIQLTPGTGGFMRPLDTVTNSGYGYRVHPIYKTRRLHEGLDFGCSLGQPIPASKAGVVTYSGWMNAAKPKSGLGIYVWIEHGGGYRTTYGHLSQTSVKVGDVVEAGTIVGACGSTGGSTGPHLHFEIFINKKSVDPAPYLGL